MQKKVPYEKIEKNKSYRKIFKTPQTNHNPPQKGECLMKPNTNPCLGHGCYDPDLGCTIPSIDRWYACPLIPEPGPEDFEGLEVVHNAEKPDV